MVHFHQKSIAVLREEAATGIHEDCFVKLWRIRIPARFAVFERQIADKTKFEEASSTDHRYPMPVLQFSTGRCIPLIPTLQQDTTHLVGHYDMAAH